MHPGQAPPHELFAAAQVKSKKRQITRRSLSTTPSKRRRTQGPEKAEGSKSFQLVLPRNVAEAVKRDVASILDAAAAEGKAPFSPGVSLE